MRSLSKANPELLFPYISKIRNFRHKAQWLTETSKAIKSDSKDPQKWMWLNCLVSAAESVMLSRRGAKASPEGVIVDLHTVRVANRLGIVNTTSLKKLKRN